MATNTNFNRIYWAITAFGVAKRGSGHGGTTQQQADATQVAQVGRKASMQCIAIYFMAM